MQMRKALKSSIEKLRRPIEADEQKASALEQNESRLLKTAILNFQRCLLAGDRYDLQVIFRLCQLWFKLGVDSRVNSEIR